MESEHDIEDGMRLSGEEADRAGRVWLVSSPISGLGALCILGAACGVNKVYQEGRKLVGGCVGRKYERIEDGESSFFRYGRVDHLRRRS